MPGVLTDHPHGATPADHLTFVADLLDAGSNLHGIPQSELGDDLPAISVMTSGSNLNTISNDEAAESMSCHRVECCGDPASVRQTNGVQGVGEHLLHCPGVLWLTRRENTSKQ